VWLCEGQINLKTCSDYQLNAQFLYSSTICILHYDPQHVSKSTLLILRRTNCITTASGIVIMENLISTLFTYRVIQEKSAIVWEMIVCVILSKKGSYEHGSDFEGY